MSAYVADGVAHPVLCPDCGAKFQNHEAFVAHREAEHPPSTVVISGAGGIESQEHVSAPGGS